MRLIDTRDISLHEFEGSDIPQYAILSHRGEDGELSLKELRKRWKHKAGWQKLRNFCRVAADKGYTYVWVDTCCIDKKSSAELSEATNSMYKWYERASVCFAYLCDVPSLPIMVSRAANGQWTPDEANDNWKGVFRSSKWFTRGWTLQELLAPKSVTFLSSTWEEVGTRGTLTNEITAATGIPVAVIEYFGTYCVAEVFSWAARRQTTRVEDRAYSLMGLFGVHLPLLYGEGENAFMRLQLEILGRSADETIFAWNSEDKPDTRVSGLLSPKLDHFQNSRETANYFWDPKRPPYSMTNQGLRIEPLVRRLDVSVTEYGSRSAWLMPLNCDKTSDVHYTAIKLYTLDADDGPETASRGGLEYLDSQPADKDGYERRVFFVTQAWSE